MDFLDSNIFVQAFYENENTEKCQEIIKNGGLTDTLVLTEAFHVIEKIVNREKAERAIKGILKLNIEIIDLNINLIFESLKRINRYKLSFYDIIHYTCALLNNCSSILSYDEDFDNEKNLEIKRKEP